MEHKPSRTDRGIGKTHRISVIAIGLLALLILAPGCGGPDDQTPSAPELKAEDAAKVDALVKEWFELAQSPQDNMTNPRCRQIAIELFQIDMQCLAPIFEVIADADTQIEEKVLAVATVDCVMGPEVVPWLIELVAPESSSDTRACAVQLLALSNDPAAIPVLRRCVQDEDRRVRLAALAGLMEQADPDARKELAALFHDDDLGQNERDRILLSFVADPREDDLPLLHEAIQDSRFSSDLRRQAIGAVGRVGNASSIELIEKAAANDGEGALADMARDAIEAIKARSAPPSRESGGAPESPS